MRAVHADCLAVGQTPHVVPHNLPHDTNIHTYIHTSIVIKIDNMTMLLLNYIKKICAEYLITSTYAQTYLLISKGRPAVCFGFFNKICKGSSFWSDEKRFARHGVIESYFFGATFFLKKCCVFPVSRMLRIMSIIATYSICSFKITVPPDKNYDTYNLKC